MRQATRVLLSIGCAGLMAASLPAQAQTLGGMSAAAGMSATLSGIGAGVAGNIAMQRARQVGQPNINIMEGGEMPATGAPAGMPPMPDAEGGAPGAAGTAAARPAPMPRNRQLSGESILATLLRSSPAAARPIPTRKERTATQRSQYARRVTGSTPEQLKRDVYEKYQKPPVGWLSYYLKDDRYKVASKVWNFVTIEDDQGRYPVKYYYTPSSPRMLALLSQSPKGVRRANRVIGFRTWQDAILAGYQPDPVSQPAPAAQIVNLARYTRGPMLARYIEFIYSGQISPQIFEANNRYFHAVANKVNADRRTRPLLSKAVNMAIGAAVGANPPPSRIIIRRRGAVQTVKTAQTSDGAPAAGGPEALPPAPEPTP